ncbi:uncharacterized protein EI90DRAFT_1090597 [Cantharellus anzutake]|uniref:uncharacterized protein n=1 Tax=Cantharellus anzutake TaxID=1750568 RepID=UPI0019068FCF|nr:uncharacterized protein EI90DRAFT_1090597 [Cantharellus anzutake]KAF8330750.1 hypothetical protein EI90DRAFT_1090597 [Cantharellus anzutake]
MSADAAGKAPNSSSAKQGKRSLLATDEDEDEFDSGLDDEEGSDYEEDEEDEEGPGLSDIMDGRTKKRTKSMTLIPRRKMAKMQMPLAPHLTTILLREMLRPLSHPESRGPALRTTPEEKTMKGISDLLSVVELAAWRDNRSVWMPSACGVITQFSSLCRLVRSHE